MVPLETFPNQVFLSPIAGCFPLSFRRIETLHLKDPAMRLLVITNQYPPNSLGSYEMQCLQICHELSRRGHQIRILTTRSNTDPANFDNTTRIFRELEAFPESGETRPSFTQLYRNVRANQRILAGHLERFVPEAIMIWGMEGLTLSLAFTAERSGISCLYAVMDPWLAHVCDDDPWLHYWNDENTEEQPWVRTLLRGLHLQQVIHNQAPIEDVSSLRLENVFFCSESLKELTSHSCGISMEHATVVPCGLSPNDIRQRDPSTPSSGRILYIAGLNEEKDPLTAIRAIQDLQQRGHSNFTLDLYGRGAPHAEAALYDYVRKFQLEEVVNFKPLLEEQARGAFHMYDMLVFTSKYPEPFPLSSIKAMAARIPVISTAEGGCGELMRDGENGFTFETNNHFDLASKIEFVTNHPEIVAQAVGTAHDEVVEYYNFDRVTSHVESLLYRALETHTLVGV